MQTYLYDSIQDQLAAAIKEYVRMFQAGVNMSNTNQANYREVKNYMKTRTSKTPTHLRQGLANVLTAFRARGTLPTEVTADCWVMGWVRELLPGLIKLYVSLHSAV